jgi:hypothetical protein
MRRAPSSSARGVALAALVCALGIAGGCGRLSFDLLPLTAGGGSGGGQDDDAGSAGSAGRAVVSGAGGMSGLANGGLGGRFAGYPQSGAAGLPCLGEGGCSDEPHYCSPSSPFCMPCARTKDCPLGDVCDPELKLCVQCRINSDCPDGQGCHPLTRRCRQECLRNEDCRGDSQHLLCARDVDMCVSCNKEADCVIYGPLNTHCFVDTCVECFDVRQCPNLPGQACFAGRCLKH